MNNIFGYYSGAPYWNTFDTLQGPCFMGNFFPDGNSAGSLGVVLPISAVQINELTELLNLLPDKVQAVQVHHE